MEAGVGELCVAHERAERALRGPRERDVLGVAARERETQVLLGCVEEVARRAERVASDRGPPELELFACVGHARSWTQTQARRAVQCECACERPDRAARWLPRDEPLLDECEAFFDLATAQQLFGGAAQLAERAIDRRGLHAAARVRERVGEVAF